MYRISKPVASSISKTSIRAFHPSPASRGLSPLFALQALANSRETQHFNKASRLSRVEHSPNLEIIRSSEVDPFKRRVPSPPDTRQPLTAEEQQAQIKNDKVPKVIPDALGRKAPGLEPSLDRYTKGRYQTGSTDAAAFNAGQAYATQQEALRANLSALEAKSETARLTYKAERKALQSRVDALEHRETIFANLVVAAVFVGAIWWWRPQLEEVFAAKNKDGRGVWDRDQMREKLEGRWRATMGGPAPAAVVRRSFDARDEIPAGAASTHAEDAMTVPKTVLTPTPFNQTGRDTSGETTGSSLSRFFWK